MQSIEERVSRLEKSNRRYRLGLLVTMLVVSAVGVMGFGDGDIVKAKQFQVLDGDGKKVAELGAGMDGGRLRINDGDGDVAVSLTGGGELGGSVTCYAPGDDKMRAVMAVDQNGRGWAALFDKHQKRIWSAP